MAVIAVLVISPLSTLTMLLPCLLYYAVVAIFEADGAQKGLKPFLSDSACFSTCWVVFLSAGNVPGARGTGTQSRANAALIPVSHDTSSPAQQHTSLLVQVSMRAQHTDGPAWQLTSPAKLGLQATTA
jgi:hypothetical protein